MSVAGIGVDVVNIDRFAERIDGTPALVARLLPEVGNLQLAVSRLAGKVALKEAALKSLGADKRITWADFVTGNEPDGSPTLEFCGIAAQFARQLGVQRVLCTVSHDAPVATAFVVLETESGNTDGGLS